MAQNLASARERRPEGVLGVDTEVMHFVSVLIPASVIWPEVQAPIDNLDISDVMPYLDIAIGVDDADALVTRGHASISSTSLTSLVRKTSGLPLRMTPNSSLMPRPMK